ncbi:MAG: tryptophan--tRNA ligase [Candidatus Jorgensenbacteria bacterium]
MIKPILISGIQPTGVLHIGNYLGALKNFVELQNSGKYQCYFFVADLHSLTEDYEPKEKPKQVSDVVLSFLAAGIDPKKSKIFVQSAIPAHTELMWILNTITPLGELERMTQFKDKSKTGIESTNVGLFTYPTLMAADILLYNVEFVPVGNDQDQHLELTRTLARKFNTRFGKIFIEPKSLHTETPRIMDLRTPSKKMSKSDPGGCLFLDDSPEEIRSKIARAETDSHAVVEYEPQNRLGMSNLLCIYSAFAEESIPALEKRYAGKGYAEFKRDLAEVIIKALAPFQKRKKKLAGQPALLHKVLQTGNKKANTVAEKKLAEVKRRVGLD